MIMQIKEANGYSKVEAFDATGLENDFSKFTNATQAWKKAQSPINHKELKTFAEGYLKGKKSIGAYIVVDGAKDDTRERPYEVISEKTDGKRKMKRSYQVVDAELKVTESKATVISKVTDKETGVESEVEKEVVVKKVKVLSEGAVQAKAGKKSEAEKLMKELISETHSNYVIKIVDEVVEGKEYAGYGLYTPSKSAKVGKFIFFSEE